MEIAETTLTLANYWLMDDFQEHFPGKCTILKAYFSSVNGKMSSKTYHIQATLELK